MDNKNSFSMQEPTLAEQSTKIFTDVRGVAIGSLVGKELAALINE